MRLDDARKQIDQIDKEMASLFEKRMDTLTEVIRYKRSNNLPIFDDYREKEVIKKNLAYIKNDEYKSAYEQFIKNTMALSRKYQSGKLNERHDLITISLCEKSYNIILRRGALNHVCDYINLNRKVMIVTDNGVPKEYIKRVSSQCQASFIHVVEQGESSKNLENFKIICEKLLELNFSRNDLVIALGGGVVGDLAGYVCASFGRGIEFCNIPTTTLSQIDSSIGGKVAVNLNNIKNVIGAFYHPCLVIIDSDTLKTLPQRHYNNGLVEAVKAGLICDKKLFNMFLEEDALDIDGIIYRSLMVKKRIVEQDENDQNLRMILNFGHTIGHALESCGGLSEMLHGEAVAVGMVSMLESEELKNRLKTILDRLNINYEIEYDKEKVFQILKKDKKSNGEKITIVKVETLGNAKLCEVEKEYLKLLL